VKCENMCNVAHAQLYKSQEKIAQFNFATQSDGFNAKIEAEKMNGHLVFKLNGVSKFSGRYGKDNTIELEFTLSELRSLNLHAFNTNLIATPEMISLKNTKYNALAELVFGRSALLHVEYEDLLVYFMGIHNGKMILKIHYQDFVSLESHLEDGNLRSELNVYDYSANSVINKNGSSFSVTGNNVEINGYSTFDSFRAEVVRPETANGSIEYKNEQLEIRSGSRLYTITSDQGLVRITPSMMA